MSADNLAIVRTLVDGIDRPDLPELVHRLEQGDASVLEDFAPLLAMLDAEIVWDVSALEVADMAVFRGHEGVIRFWIQWMAEWESMVTEASNFEAVGDHVVFDVVARGTSRLMGARAEWQYAVLMTLREDKVVAYRTFANRGDALATT